MSALKFEVKIVSIESVKPSSPTQSHLRDYKLSYVDQIVPLVPFFPTCGLLFYTATSQTQPLNISRLKTSLSETLARFYPIAGRVRQSMINCNDEGIPFIETHVNCALSTVLNSDTKLDVVSKFLPPKEALGIVAGEKPVTEVVHLAIQLNIFTCGGVAIGWYDTHKAMDGMSSATFFKSWAALAGGQCSEDLVLPNFNAAVATFPPLANYEPPPMMISGIKDIVLAPTPLVKRFIFRNVAIGDLKAKAVSDQVPKPSRFQAVAGFIWEKALEVSMKAAISKTLGESDKLKDTVLQVTIDMRSRINPPMPKSSMGNLATIAVACAEKQAKLSDFVAGINVAVSKLNDEIKEFQGDKAVEGVRENWNKLMKISSVYKDKAYKLVSWCRLGFNELDFGFGKPTLVVPTDGIISPFQRNVIILNDYVDDNNGDGIEAWLFLEEKEMDMLESDEEFRAFVSRVHWCAV